MFLDISHFHDFFSFSFSDIFPSVFLLYFFPPFSKCVFLISLVNHNPVLSFSNSIHLSHWEWRERRQAFGCGLWIPGFFLISSLVSPPSFYLLSLITNTGYIIFFSISLLLLRFSPPGLHLNNRAFGASHSSPFGPFHFILLTYYF